MFIAITLISWLLFAPAQALEPVIIHRDEGGMPRCLEWVRQGKENHFYLYWQPSSAPQIHGVNLRELARANSGSAIQIPRRCDRWDRIDEVVLNYQSRTLLTEEMLSELGVILAPEFHRALEQIRQGARIYRSEEGPEEFLRHNPMRSFHKDQLKNFVRDYGRSFADALYRSWVALLDLPDDCQSLIGQCEYYLCREKKNSCGTRGYYLAFGYQYCSQSLHVLMDEVSPRGQQWLSRVAACLQRGLEEKVPPETTCAEVKELAVEGHSNCYVEAQFCEQKLSDIIRILSMLRPELTQPQILQEGLQVIGRCLQKEQV